MASDLTNRLGGARSSLAFKAPVRCATTANITLSGFQTIDGITPTSTDTNLRILVKDQTSAVTNGLYEMSTGSWVRCKDMDGAGDVVKGTRVYVVNGTTNGDTGWVVSAADPIVVGTDSITFSEPSDEAAVAAAAAAASEAAAAASAATASTQATNAATSATTASTQATNAATSASNAATSASAASTSASAASTSASNAAASATTASTQATNAAASATTASTQATNAAASATSASGSATTASTQATNAAASASSASTSASTATTQASNASTSASNAATSETNAATSATNASNSASSASTSASTATTQASNASTSASNAATSASNAATSETNAATSAATAAAAAGFTWTYSTTTAMADPGTGTIRLNNATMSSVTAAAIDDLSADSGNPDVSSRILTWDDSTNTTKGTLLLRYSTSFWAEFTVTGLTDNVGWTELALTYVGNTGTISNGNTLVSSFSRTGNKGADGAGTGDVVGPGSATDNAIARYDGTTGKLVQDSVVTIADTTGVVAGAKFANAAGVPILDSNASHVLGITTSSDLTADRLLTLVPGDAARTVTISGNATISQDYSSTGSPTFADPIVTSITTANTGLHILDTNASHDLIIAPGSDLTADRTLTITTGDADRTLTISASATVSQDYSTTGNPQFATIELGAASDTTLARSAAGEVSIEGVVVKKVGKETIFIPAGAMTPRTTNGAASGTAETSTNDIMLKLLDFDTTTEEGAGFWIAMPKSWNESTVTFKAFWTTGSGSGGVAWGLAAYAYSDDDLLDTAVSGQQIVTDTLIAAGDMHATAESSAITIGGTPAEGDMIYFELTREVGNASDTIAVDARLFGIQLFFTTNASTDA